MQNYPVTREWNVADWLDILVYICNQIVLKVKKQNKQKNMEFSKFLRHLFILFSLCFFVRKCSVEEQCESTPVSLHWGISIQYPLNFKVEIEFKVFNTMCLQNRQPQIRLNNSICRKVTIRKFSIQKGSILSIYLYIYLSIYLPIYLYIYLYIYRTRLQKRRDNPSRTSSTI